MSGDRVHYRETQTLKQDDLGDEQAYRIQSRRRHNIAHHGWGIVRGLQLDIDQVGVFLDPGFAVDGYGREIIVEKRVDFSVELLQKLIQEGSVIVSKKIKMNEKQLADNKDIPSYAIDVWLNYRARIHEPDEKSIAQEMFKGTGRVCEESWLKLHCADPASMVNPYRPPGVPTTDLEFEPHRNLPIDKNIVWPVYLGRIGIYLEEGVRIDLPVVEKPYAGLVGAGINAPWKGSWLQVGTSNFSDTNRFSVVLPDEQGNPVRRLSLNKYSNALLKGNVRFKRLPEDKEVVLPDKLTLIQSKNALKSDVLKSALGFTALETVPEEAFAWSLYHSEIKSENATTKKQLRFEIFNPGGEGNPALSQWVVGDRKEPTNEASLPILPALTVRADGTVVVRGTLEVIGQSVEAPVPLDFNDPRFRDELILRWTKGLTTAGREVDAYYAVVLNFDIRFFDGGAEVAPDALQQNTNYTIEHTVTNLSRNVDVRITRLEMTTEYEDSGDNIKDVFYLPQQTEIKVGETELVTQDNFKFIQTGNANFLVSIITSGQAQTATDAMQSIKVEIN